MKDITVIVSRSLFLQTLLFVILTDVSVILNIPFLRQFSGFIFLTFVPGFLLLLSLRLNKLGLLEKIVLSVGLSVTFTMLFGLLLNSLLLVMGYPKPLSSVPLLVSFSIAVVILTVIARWRSNGAAFSVPVFDLSNREKAFLIVPALFPLLTFLGTRIMNLNNDNTTLMLSLFLIPAYLVFIALYRGRISDRLYPILTFFISISLILMLPLRLQHILGSDAHSMYYLFQLTLSAGHWSLFTHGLLDATISITLFPAVYQVFLDINPEYLFNMLFPILFSLSPLIVYAISVKYIGGFNALMASFLFMAQFVFLWTAGSPNTNMAILFFAMAIMVSFHEDINEIVKRLLFILFAFSSILSHYSSSYIFFFLLLLTWVGMQIIPRLISSKELPGNPEGLTGGGTTRNSLSDAVPRDGILPTRTASAVVTAARTARGVSATMVVLFFVLLFIWYGQITIAPFEYGVGFIRETFLNLSRWFVLESRGSTITAAVGENIVTAPQEIRFVFSWLTVILTGIGVVGTMARYRKTVAAPGADGNRPEFLKKRFEVEFLILSMAASAILVATAVLPFVSRGYSMERTYSQAMVVLSLFFCIGGITVARLLRLASHWAILIVLVPFFMSTTGTMYQLMGYPASLMLNSTGTEYQRLYVHDEESYAARWLIEHAQENVPIFTSGVQGSNVLVSQGKTPYSRVKDAFVLVKPSRVVDAYLFLRRADNISAQVVTKYPHLFAGKNKLYTAGAAETYR